MKVSIKRLKMVLMIDEATTLVGMKFYNAFRWVIDQVIEPAWLLSWENSDLPKYPLPFTTIFMGTHSKVTHFLPPKHEASARYTFDVMKIPEPFTALDWDIEVPNEIKQLKRYNPLMYSSLADMTWLARFGRPCWMAQWGTSLEIVRRIQSPKTQTTLLPWQGSSYTTFQRKTGSRRSSKR